jgi:aminopeptidase N
MNEPKTIYLNDYRPHPYAITHCDLSFEIGDSATVVTGEMRVKARENAQGVLELDGEALKLLFVECDGERLSSQRYEVTDTGLRIFDVPTDFSLRIATKITPDTNTALEGLYRSGAILCTQNEPEGFRRIIYFIDRPDNMCVFTTRITADASTYPILLGNGNLQERGELDGGRHYALWNDPFPKPTYLFAIVAGDLGFVSDTFCTRSGREVALNIYVDKGNESKCAHAMRSLKNAMKWDEERYGREYDLEVYSVVAADSFNMGAMENKGLNIFNSHYVLADEETATDTNFLGIESVIAHEYFHNWTGNRITCRDWFQLTLKEGLTVFRDQCFSADMNSEVVQRISDVKALRERQFAEDAGPTAHPIKPDQYIEINNFYTSTVYEKGAEVIRMLHTLLGEEGFRKGMDLYFETFDGQAVRTEDFLWAMRKGGGMELEGFERWYRQERTPQLSVETAYNEAAFTYTLRLRQEVPKSVEGKEQLPYYFPLGFALLDGEGETIGCDLEREDQPLLGRGLLIVKEKEEVFEFTGVDSEPKLSLNTHFTAPLKLHYPGSDHAFLMRHDKDGFNRYEAAQTYTLQTLQQIMEGGTVDAAFVDIFGEFLEDTSIDLQCKAQMLELPTISLMMQEQAVINVAPIAAARKRLTETVAKRYKDVMRSQYEILHDPKNRKIDAISMGERAVKNRLLGYMMSLEDDSIHELCLKQYRESVTMTDRIAALDLLENHAPFLAEGALREFYDRYRHDTLVMNKYLSILAASEREGTIDRVQALENDPVYNAKVPNLVRSLIGVFARNMVHFHDASGHGYAYIAQKVTELDAINPTIASSLAGAFKHYRRLNPHNKALMKRELERILGKEGISKNVYEILEKIVHSDK